jgi:peptide/nickel transport system substrate-binding protein
MEQSYWSRAFNQRIARRRALALGGGAALGSTLLLACGGDGGDGDEAGSDLVTESVDTTKEAKRGGTLKDVHNFDPATLDPGTPVAPLNGIIRHTYGTLVTEKAGHLESSTGELVGDAAESWEITPDRLQIALRLRQGMKWHNKPPVNARTVDVEDVIFSWERYARLSPFRSLSSNAVNPDAPILSVTPTDARTVTVRLKEPLAYALKYFASYGSTSGNLIMLPREADAGLDIRRNIVGHGPFEVANYQPAVAFTLRRNPEYYDKDFALVDQLDIPIVPEYAARRAQFQAGNTLRMLANEPQAEDVTSVKRDEPRLEVYETDYSAQPWILSFGWNQQQFRDERVRQAVSMAIDRDSWIDALYNVSGYERDGLPVETRWNTHLLSIWDEEWLDPKGRDFGPNARYFQFDLAEAKKMMAAAGHPNGFAVQSTYPVEGLALGRFAEPVDGMLRELLQISINNPNYNNEYIPVWRDAQGQYEGWLYGSVTGTTPQVLDPVSALAAEYWPKGGTTFRGFSTTATPKAGDPEVTSMIEKARLEPDAATRTKLVQDLQRYLAKAMYGLNLPGGSPGYTLVWPALRNYQVWRVRQGGSAIWNSYRLWVDTSLPPFAG